MIGTPDTDLRFINEAFIAGSVSPAAYDELLAAGWRHFGIHFQRYNLALYEDEVRMVIPLRVRLSEFRLSKSQRRALRRNEDLETEIRPIKITGDVHELFAWHKRRFSSGVPESIYTFLSDDPATVPAEGLQLSVRRGSQLVAASFFDVGVASISSMYGIFLPRETARSLGIFTMLKEIEFARATGREFYYHGYCYEGESYYDYKKRFSGLERYDWDKTWSPFAETIGDVWKDGHGS